MTKSAKQRTKQRVEKSETVSLYLDNAVIERLEQFRATGILGPTLSDVVCHIARESLIRDWIAQNPVRLERPEGMRFAAWSTRVEVPPAKPARKKAATKKAPAKKARRK